MPFKCDECSKETYMLHYLLKVKKDKGSGEYCNDCYNKKLEEKQNGKRK